MIPHIHGTKMQSMIEAVKVIWSLAVFVLCILGISAAMLLGFAAVPWAVTFALAELVGEPVWLWSLSSCLIWWITLGVLISRYQDRELLQRMKQQENR